MRIGIFGGTFDPVHAGHVRMVESAAMKFRLERVHFVPAGISPHKIDPPTDSRHRVAMLALALAGRPDWVISFEELDREGPSYTVDTLRALSARLLHDELWLLMGTDTLAGLTRWKDPEALVALARVAAFYRDPYRGDRLVIPPVDGLRERLEVFDAGSVTISSSEVREDLARGGRPEGKVPGPVAEYITKHRLYSARAGGR